jgi:predicted permease
VIGSIAGLFIASFPRIRGLLVNIWGVNGKAAPLQWMFDGITSVGNAAVPINMTILGINLSSTFKKKSKEEEEKDKAKLLPNRTMLAVVFGKMVVMPILGIVSTWFLQRYYVDFPDAIDATCYLVMMIVFITPTANNVMVMVELSGSSSKEGMARVIGYQYMVAPVILSVVLAVVVSLASCHFEKSPVCSV